MSHRWKVLARVMPGVNGAAVSEVSWCLLCGTVRERHDTREAYLTLGNEEYTKVEPGCR